jgi:glycolate oxidase FAD binding subunit
MPDQEAALAAVVAACHQNRWPILPCGQGSKLSWGGLATAAPVVLSTARLNRVVAHWADDFTVRGEAGLRLADLQRQLAAQQQWLPVDPLYPDQATLGGMVATADTGSLRQRYGGIRDLLIGVQFVRHDGQIVKAGGRVVKNVAGYDLMKLMTGAYGTLGLLTQLTFRLYPQPATSQTILLSGDPEAIAKAALQVRLAGLTPVALDLWAGGPQHPTPHAPLLAGRFQGIPAGVTEQVTRFAEIGKLLGLTQQLLSETDEVAFWQALPVDDGDILGKVGLRPTAILPFLQQLAACLPAGWSARLHNGSGLGLVRWAAGGAAVPDKALVETVRSHCEAHQGFFTLLQAPIPLKQGVEIWGYGGNALEVMQQLKANFDPWGGFSPGRYLGTI